MYLKKAGSLLLESDDDGIAGEVEETIGAVFWKRAGEASKGAAASVASESSLVLPTRASVEVGLGGVSGVFGRR